MGLELKVHMHSMEEVLLRLQSKGKSVQTEGRKTLIKFEAELGETARESEQQQGGACLPGHWAATPEQLLTLSHNSNRLADADTESHDWQRSCICSLSFPVSKIGFAFSGAEGFLCVRCV